MKRYEAKQIAFGWVIGYFIFFYPMRMIFSFPVIPALLHCILGVGVAIAILLWGVYNEN